MGGAGTDRLVTIDIRGKARALLWSLSPLIVPWRVVNRICRGRSGFGGLFGDVWWGFSSPILMLGFAVASPGQREQSWA